MDSTHTSTPRRQRCSRGVSPSPQASAARLSPKLFKRFSDLAYRKAGIVLKPGKESLVAARISRRLCDLKLTSEMDYLRYLETEGEVGDKELVRFLDVISTNFTNFFREPDHFVYLTQAVKQWVADGQRSLSIWCAASSTGEEPYTLAMTLLEAIGGNHTEFRILATDISTKVLARARAGVYEDTDAAQIPRQMRNKYFDRIDGDSGKPPCWQVKPVLRDRIVFRRLNLSTPPFPMRGPFDAVFCRNVMIYFDNAVRQRLVDGITDLIKPDGVLITGHSESIAGNNPQLYTVRPSIYRRHDDAQSGTTTSEVR